MVQSQTREQSMAEELSEGLAIAAANLGLELGIISRIVGSTYHVEHVHDPGGTIRPGQSFPLEHTYCSITFAAERVVSIDEIGRSEHRGHPCYRRFRLESYLGAPLWVQGEPYGTLNFSSSHRRIGDYGPAERGLVQLLARWIETRLEADLAQRAQQLTQAKLGHLLEAVPDGIMLHRDGVIVEANLALAQMLGVESPAELVGTAVQDLILQRHHREQTAERMAALARGEAQLEPLPVELVRRDGGSLWVEGKGVPIALDGGLGVLTIVRDLSARDGFNRSLHTQRLALLGSLAAGLAHDLKSPLSTMSLGLSHLAGVVDQLPPLPHKARIERDLGDLSTSIGSMRDIARSLLDFSSRGGGRELYDLHDLLKIAIELTKHELSRCARLVVVEGELPRVRVDGPRLTQVLVNLLVNASQAIGEGDTRANEVRIETSLDEAGGPRIIVSDTGPGFAEELLDQVFARFFTTKPLGEGTGLGLTMSREIVEEHGGTLTARNRSEGGAELTVSLPVSVLESSASRRIVG
ncbi:MAG: PAS domain S-box protein [Myxococcales bacterium]|nr:PAS domain S-box protein [Myxococcales bacterium]MCB9713893.1 PAS domain S-box protein [Myxococcales bacterium]